MGTHCSIMDNLSIFVLDDNPVSLSIISKILGKFNFKVLPFQTAEAALDSLRWGVAKEEELDLVLAEVHLSNTAMGTLANSELFHHILNELQVPLITMCAYDDEEAVSECMALGASFHVLKPLNTGTFNILKQKALQHRSRRAIPEGSSILEKTKRRMNLSSTKKPKRMFIPEISNARKSESEEDEEPDVWKACGYSKKPGRFKWSIELHEKFLEAVEVLGGKSATPEWILQRMNVKDLTLKQIASHLQKHRLHKQKAKEGQDQWNASMKPVSGLIISSHNAATSKSINQLATTQTPTTPRVAAAIREKYPIRLWTQMEERSAEAAASKIYRDDKKSVWDKYQKGLQKRLSLSSKRQLLTAKSKAVSKDEGIANEAPNAAGEKGYGEPASAPLESSGSSSLLTSLLDQVGENSRTEAAGNNGDPEDITLHEDIMNKEYTAAMGADGLVDLGSSALLDGTNKSSAAEMELSDPSYGWEAADTFWVSQLEGSQEHKDLVPDDLLQVDNAWNDALQSTSLTNMDAAMAQEAANGDAPAYDPVQQFAEGNAFWNWSPHVVGDYGMLL